MPAVYPLTNDEPSRRRQSPYLPPARSRLAKEGPACSAGAGLSRRRWPCPQHAEVHSIRSPGRRAGIHRRLSRRPQQALERWPRPFPGRRRWLHSRPHRRARALPEHRPQARVRDGHLEWRILLAAAGVRPRGQDCGSGLGRGHHAGAAGADLQTRAAGFGDVYPGHQGPAGGPVARTHGRCVSLAAASSFWRNRDQTSSTPVSADLPDDAHDGTRIHRDVYGGGQQGTEVVVYTIEGGGHTWPSGPQYLPALLVGKTSHNLDATRTIWEFFQKHSQP